MATSLGFWKYVDLIKKFFPRGWVWRFRKNTKFTLLCEALANEPCRVEERLKDFLDELDPNTTFELIETWERMLRIPDECTPDGDPSIFERRVRILQKLTTGGGQNEAFFKLIAQQLGYDAEIIDAKNFTAFRVGLSRVGDPLANTDAWQYTWVVKAPVELVRRFRVGQSTVGERLVLFQNDTLECVIRKFAPAHTTVLFSFGE